MSRIGIRARVTLAFSVAMAVVLVALGFFLYSKHSEQLTQAIDQGLRSRSGEVTALIRDSPRALRNSARSLVIERDESFTQVLDENGTVLDSTPQLRGQVLLDPSELAAASQHLRFFNHPGLAGVDGGGRLLATPIVVRGRKLISVVGASLGDRRDALANLARLLVLGGLAALALSSLVGFAAVTAALRPVEAMRRRAAEISAGGPDERLPVPAGSDQIARLGETLNAMLARLQDGIERERRFVDDASHELRTPLALQRTELELALRYGKDEHELRAAIASGVEEVDRLIGLAEGLLLVARSAEGRVPLEREQLSSAALFDGIASRFDARVRELGREITLDGEGVELYADRLRIEQALTGMLDNALRHGEGEVTLRADTRDRTVTLQVLDRGPGFDPEFLPRAFERFSRGDAARARGGAGLGMAIIDGIAQAHGGTAFASNRAGGGAEVGVEIPMEPQA